jgi:hypothetical protein
MPYCIQYNQEVCITCILLCYIKNNERFESMLNMGKYDSYTQVQNDNKLQDHN